MAQPPHKQADPAPGSPLRNVVPRFLQEFVQTEAFGGFLLIMTAGAALICANSGLAPAYHHFLETPIRVGGGPFLIDKSIHHWINDGLMTVFFFLVGLEIKREVLAGELASLRRAALPMIAALGGMIVPAGLYALINRGGAGMAGWGIPMATDIAFALGVLALFGSAVPAGILVFLTAVAIADDLGAVIVIALFYGGEIAALPLLAGAVILSVSFLLSFFGVRRTLPYALLGAALWLAFLKSGVHSTVAGILLAMTIPTQNRYNDHQFVDRIQTLIRQFSTGKRAENPLEREEDQQAILQKMANACQEVQAPLRRMERQLHPWVIYIIMPIFAFANAGVEISLDGMGEALAHPVTLGIVAGLVAGKPIGIFLFSWFAVRLGWAELPSETGWPELFGVACLGGIGFTMSLFIGSLAFSDPHFLGLTKIGILIASLVSGIAGYGFLKKVMR